MQLVSHPREVRKLHYVAGTVNQVDEHEQTLQTQEGTR